MLVRLPLNKIIEPYLQIFGPMCDKNYSLVFHEVWKFISI